MTREVSQSTDEYANRCANVNARTHIDPLLGEVSELLHRMESCRSLDPFQWMARDAIEKLRQYEMKASNAHVTR